MFVYIIPPDAKIESQLEIVWSRNALNQAGHQSLWAKEWKKHGNYGSPTTRNEKGYFEAVIKMYNTIEKQNVSEIISKAKIEPDGKIRT